MTTFSDILLQHPNATEMRVSIPNPQNLTDKWITLSVDNKFRTRMLLLAAFEQHLDAVAEATIITDDRIQDIVDKTVGELQFTVDVS